MTRTRILAEAHRAFARHGYAAASLRQIAGAVGIKTPSLYAHFPSKRALYEAVYAEVMDEHAAFFAELVDAGAELPPLERVRELLRGVLRFYEDRPLDRQFSLRAAVEEDGSGGQPLRQILIDSESVLVDTAQRAFLASVGGADAAPEDGEGFAALVLLVMDGLFLQQSHYGPERSAERFERAWRHLAAALDPVRPVLSQGAS